MKAKQPFWILLTFITMAIVNAVIAQAQYDSKKNRVEKPEVYPVYLTE